MTDNKLQPSTGCWIDGSWGQYGILRLIEIAASYGFRVTADEASACVAYKAGEDKFWTVNGESFETADWILNQGGVGDKAEEWLNENIAQEGFSFAWHDGEFFYMNTSWSEE